MTHDCQQAILILFGSRATGKARADSDWDIGVVSDHRLTLDERGEFAMEAARILGVTEDNVDLVDLWGASPLLQDRVAREGELLTGDSRSFVRFQILARKRYLDTTKLRRLRHEALQQYGK